MAGTSLIVEFYGYRPRLASSSIRKYLEAAFQEFRTHGGATSGSSHTLMGIEVRSYNASNTYLSIFPSENMTWGMWYDVISAMRVFQSRMLSNPRQTSFVLLHIGRADYLGYGSLTREWWMEG